MATVAAGGGVAPEVTAPRVAVVVVGNPFNRWGGDDGMTRTTRSSKVYGRAGRRRRLQLGGGVDRRLHRSHLRRDRDTVDR